MPANIDSNDTANMAKTETNETIALLLFNNFFIELPSFRKKAILCDFVTDFDKNFTKIVQNLTV